MSTSLPAKDRITLFELLLEQFRGMEGELPSATAYLVNAAMDRQAERRRTITQIAREKIENAEILAAILVHLARRRRGRFSRNPPPDELHQLLHSRSIKTDCFEIAKAFARRVEAIETGQQALYPFPRDPHHYLKRYIELEDRQIDVYSQLIDLAKSRSIVDALQEAQRRQQAHREQIAELLQRVTDEEGFS